MHLEEYYSHLNGYEYIQFRHPQLWAEILEVIGNINAEEYRTKVSRERTMRGQLLYDPAGLNTAFKTGFNNRGWHERRAGYYVTRRAKLIRRTLTLQPEEQRAYIEAEGETAMYSYNQTDFVKDRIAVEVQFGKYFSVAYDMFVKHLAFYIGDHIDVGVEIVPMRSLSGNEGTGRGRGMSTGVSYFEKELYNLIREGRGVPAVPLVLIGVAP